MSPRMKLEGWVYFELRGYGENNYAPIEGGKGGGSKRLWFGWR